MYLKYPMPDHPTPRDDVAAVQRMLAGLGYKGLTQPEGQPQASIAEPTVRNLVTDGVFGPVTESAVEAFQEEEGILVDGVVGPSTMEALEEAWARRANELDSPAAGGVIFDDIAAMSEPVARYRLSRVTTNTDEWNEKLTKAERERLGYDIVNLRSDVAAAYEKVRDIVNDHGGYMTSSGGIRGLGAKVSPGRSATSMHYLGRALDLQIYSGMVDPKTDPFVITGPNDKGKWTVYARARYKKTHAKDMTLKKVATDRSRVGKLSTKGRFVNLTALFAEHGFHPIRPRKSFLKGGSRIGAEFWHFQYEVGLVPGVSTFGAELQRLYPLSKLEHTPPWRHRDATFKIDWF
ncbi:peptidoglycan-binding domain-containing protein [uncultured Ruegeria sp.]|uniref:peptidoglycan-binding domain-containing protein n=1 Tax=uncultured Ruegeria sp. TaxID=259304 RepID=UPI00260DA5C9|nr:peptidoglycan-binding domain-containing protein [uncultured Ruegeria sp.]